MKLKTRRFAGILCFMSLGAALAACSAGSSSPGASTPAASASGTPAAIGTPALTTVSVGNFPSSALTLPFAIAQDQGYFRDADLNVQAVSATSGPALASELIGGTTQIAVEVPSNAFPAMQQGEPLVALPPFGRLDLAIVTPSGSGVISLKQLVGKTIGVTALGASTETFAQYVLKAQGINPKSVTFVAVGALATQEVALRNHVIDATVLSSDTIAAATAHGIKLVTLASSLGGTAGQLGAIGLPGQPPRGREGLLQRDDAGDGLPGRQREPQRRPADHREAAERPGHCRRPGLEHGPRGMGDAGRLDQVGGQRRADPRQPDEPPVRQVRR